MWKGIFLTVVAYVIMDTSEILFCDCLVCFRSCSLFLFCFRNGSVTPPSPSPPPLPALTAQPLHSLRSECVCVPPQP